MKTSEWVSLGHPDKTADYISEYILDRIVERDRNARYALEVQIKDMFVTLGGEITTCSTLSDEEITRHVRDAVNSIGYTREYQRKWGMDNTVCGDDIEVYPIIGTQSPDIAKGVDSDGWGDQGIFFGMAVNNEKTMYMPMDVFLAREIGMELLAMKCCGIDIKTQVSIDSSNILRQVIVAAPTMTKRENEVIETITRNVCVTRFGSYPDEIIVNGTGSYVRHSSFGDCGTTGRKLAVDFYGGNCEIGGGSPWTKDVTKADLTLNAYARHLAVNYVKEHGIDAVKCRISCCIGRPDIFITFADMSNKEVFSFEQEMTPLKLAEKLGINRPCFAELCRTGLPYAIM